MSFNIAKLSALVNGPSLTNLADQVTYSRLASGSTSALAPFTVSAILSTGGEYSDPAGKIFGNAAMTISSIPCGPKKGDLIAFAGRTYTAQELFQDTEADWVEIKLRWTGQ